MLSTCLFEWRVSAVGPRKERRPNRGANSIANRAERQGETNMSRRAGNRCGELCRARASSRRPRLRCRSRAPRGSARGTSYVEYKLAAGPDCIALPRAQEDSCGRRLPDLSDRSSAPDKENDSTVGLGISDSGRIAGDCSADAPRRLRPPGNRFRGAAERVLQIENGARCDLSRACTSSRCGNAYARHLRGLRYARILPILPAKIQGEKMTYCLLTAIPGNFGGPPIQA